MTEDIPAVTRAARTTPFPFVDRLEYRRSDGNVTCSHQLPITATPSRVTKEIGFPLTGTPSRSPLRYPLIFYFSPSIDQCRVFRFEIPSLQPIHHSSTDLRYSMWFVKVFERLLCALNFQQRSLLCVLSNVFKFRR